MARRPYSKRHCPRSETEIQGAIVLVLRLHYRALVAITDAGVLRRHGVRHRGSGMPEGWPDLTVLLPGGRFVGIEVKAAKGCQSKVQKLMQEQFKELGHEYVLARSVDDVIAAVEGNERTET